MIGQSAFMVLVNEYPYVHPLCYQRWCYLAALDDHSAKELLDWEQSTTEAIHIISKLPFPGNIVLDCFMGIAATGIAANERMVVFLVFNVISIKQSIEPTKSIRNDNKN